MIIRVEKLISVNGQEIRKTAEADIPDDHPRMDEVASDLMRSISLRETKSPPKPREFWIVRGYDGVHRVYKTEQQGLTELEQVHVREVLRDEGET